MLSPEQPDHLIIWMLIFPEKLLYISSPFWTLMKTRISVMMTSRLIENTTPSLKCSGWTFGFGLLDPALKVRKVPHLNPFLLTPLAPSPIPAHACEAPPPGSKMACRVEWLWNDLQEAHPNISKPSGPEINIQTDFLVN